MKTSARPRVRRQSRTQQDWESGGRRDGPIEEKIIENLIFPIAHALDEMFNDVSSGGERKTGFVLMVFPFDDPDRRCNYISNGTRRDIVAAMKEMIARFEGYAEVKGNA